MTQLEVPVECMWWAVEQPPELVVLDDMSVVDLDWWNSRCAQREIPVHITGRAPMVSWWTAVGRRCDVVIWCRRRPALRTPRWIV